MSRARTLPLPARALPPRRLAATLALPAATGTVLRLAAAVGLCVAILAHGLVDYLLAFTGHYLFLGFLIGGIAAAADRT